MALPAVPARVSVSPVPGDNTARIQAAIDCVSQLAPEPQHGLRGAVILKRGRYKIAGQLRIAASGVVLRGEGSDENGTVLVATGTDRRTMIELAGRNDRVMEGVKFNVTDRYVPVGATKLHLDHASGLQSGATVIIERPGTKEWIAAIGMDQSAGPNPFAWKPGTLNIRWDRVVRAVRFQGEYKSK